MTTSHSCSTAAAFLWVSEKDRVTEWSAEATTTSCILCTSHDTKTCFQKSSCSLVMPLRTQTPSKPSTLGMSLLSLLLFSFQTVRHGMKVCFSVSCSSYLPLFPPMVIESGCRPVKTWSGGVGGEEEGQKQRRQREWLERAGSHSAGKHVRFSQNSLCVNQRLWAVLINEKIYRNSHKSLDAYW